MKTTYSEVEIPANSELLEDDSSPTALAGLATPVIPPSPVTGHALTVEDARRGGQTRAAQLRAARDDRRLTAEQRLARAMDERMHEIISAMLGRVVDEADVAAFRATWDRAYGAPATRVEVEATNDRQAPEDAVERMQALREQLKQLEP